MRVCISEIIVDHPELTGLYQISSSPISKFELMKLVNEVLQLNINIIPENEPELNKTLFSNKFYKKTNIKAPPWKDQIEKLKMTHQKK